jgi:hypothetical protein
VTRRYSYPACNVHATYYHVSPLYNIFPFCFLNDMIFKERVNEHKMCVLIFSIIFARNVSHSKKYSSRHHECTTNESDFSET